MSSNTSTWLLLAALSLLPLNLTSGATAQAKLYNRSIQMHQGACSCGFGLIYYLHFSTFNTDDPSLANEELAPQPQPAGFTHWSFMILEDPSMYGSTTLAQLDVPKTDSNGDGIPDIFDTTQNVSAGTQGTYENDWGTQVIIAIWARTAGSTRGSCKITLKDSILGELGPFQNTFDVVQYQGTLAYTPGSNSVAATISLAKVGDAGLKLAGPIDLQKSPTNRFNQLTFESATWTNNLNGPMTFSAGTLNRDLERGTNYTAALQSWDSSYVGWTLSVDDPNDSNHNGIPDLSDDLAVPPPRAPALALSSSPTDLRLTIHGDVGRTHRILEASSPASTAWIPIKTVQLTSDPQVISLPLPSGQPKFWRVEAQ